jgi:hypothetical protein
MGRSLPSRRRRRAAEPQLTPRATARPDGTSHDRPHRASASPAPHRQGGDDKLPAPVDGHGFVRFAQMLRSNNARTLVKKWGRCGHSYRRWREAAKGQAGEGHSNRQHTKIRGASELVSCHNCNRSTDRPGGGVNAWSVGKGEASAATNNVSRRAYLHFADERFLDATPAMPVDNFRKETEP